MSTPAKRSRAKKSALRKAALVTGAGVRLGCAIALALADDGYDLVLHAHASTKEARALAKEITTLGRRAKVIKADLSKPVQVKRLAREAWQAFGGLDVLINNAARFAPTPLEGLDERAFDDFIGVNLKAPYLLGSMLGRRMKKRGHGAMVNLSCLSAAQPWKQFVPYSISKAGVSALTVGLAKLLAPEVRVNAVAPGTVLPPDDYTPTQRKRLKTRIPLQRLGTPEDVVRAVRYLLDAEFVTGQVHAVDGGRSVV